MAIEIYLPKMSDHMESGTIVHWLVKEGQPVSQGQVLVEVETDKAVGEIESPGPGILAGVNARDGDEVRVGVTIAYILQPGEELPQEDHSPVGPAETRTGQISAVPKAEFIEEDESQILAVPAARKAAKELGIDLQKIKGTGPGGRIRVDDVYDYAMARSVDDSEG